MAFLSNHKQALCECCGTITCCGRPEPDGCFDDPPATSQTGNQLPCDLTGVITLTGTGDCPLTYNITLSYQGNYSWTETFNDDCGQQWEVTLTCSTTGTGTARTSTWLLTITVVDLTIDTEAAVTQCNPFHLEFLTVSNTTCPAGTGTNPQTGEQQNTDWTQAASPGQLYPSPGELLCCTCEAQPCIGGSSSELCDVTLAMTVDE